MSDEMLPARNPHPFRRRHRHLLASRSHSMASSWHRGV